MTQEVSATVDRVADRVPQLELGNQLCFALYAASRATTRAYGPELAELGLTYPQYLTMLVLWEASEPLAVGDIGARLHLDSGTLTPLLKRLEDLGLATRSRDRADERRVLIALTGPGRELRARAAEVPLRLFQRYGIDIDTAQKLIRDLTALTESLQAST
ncbi:DNA-binding transcriptional regulator, MarR family [Parafrankia irregularis]|uniref:DNA-binding transcriptional regulator, MarR family n=1 Tax=Parafrankia irregularis TaxID=795642 RepID=A0A0S4QL42_9ACTN|nr:MarR family transcriptional regulator [Parafrankia sp. CH37]CUU56305.1 DNA-binding transcriptional regulator, MarR family [Parafrankia irregularis]